MIHFGCSKAHSSQIAYRDRVLCVGCDTIQTWMLSFIVNSRLYAELLSWSGTSVQLMRYRHNYTHVFVVRPIGKHCDLRCCGRTHKQYVLMCANAFSVGVVFVAWLSMRLFTLASHQLTKCWIQVHVNASNFMEKFRGELGIFRLMRRW